MPLRQVRDDPSFAFIYLTFQAQNLCELSSGFTNVMISIY